MSHPWITRRPVKRPRRVRRHALGRLRVNARPGTKSGGLLIAGPCVIRCALGSGGLTAFKREGDGATPMARMPLLHGHWRPDRLARPRTPIALSPLRPDMGWSDDPTDGRYNRPVTVPFAGSHEVMCRKDHLYDIVVVLDYNLSSRGLHRGSAIFFHLAHEDHRPTAGCVAVDLDAMRRLLPRLARTAVIDTRTRTLRR